MSSRNLIGSYGVEVISGYIPHVSTSGMVRWNGMYQRFEVMDGDRWIELDSNCQTTIGLTNDVMSAILWAQDKQAEDAKLKELCEKHRGLKDLKEKFEVMLALVQEHEKDVEDK